MKTLEEWIAAKHRFCVHIDRSLPPLEHGCLLGLDVDAMIDPSRPGCLRRLPCNNHGTSEQENVTCASFQAPTEEQMKESYEGLLRSTERITKVLPLLGELKRKHRKGGGGTVRCPCCGKPLHYGVAASNGHIRARCETNGCVAIME